ncbi:hypothetical protein GW819_03155 [Candidatus Gracilibacteria bacterium]|nr:hypothetical protein [Candidatus Gracilibacteria bacterium]OIO77926.1 MAG: hypothetical protein AUJ87_00605 [Candidatus Gracilibacteria bacterium CG1_02_38_174]PIQ12247.1 MAG: hypothetical protein COW68_00450 [Candidatus Gracilibacteria bacterium CG18_big_fil_WC_8_21_14_2_50_38_16]PIQ40987.1 MAG: hypothetical protein COW06_04405 [Candidatus Gracilibacteria bacterium CG12_big_fil_rev_8_21_14_0_65_38_15]PIZ01300.1 MAG: hypothetical protein COY60_04250 [Candidatus Gracilibacteria bacterium CG_4
MYLFIDTISNPVTYILFDSERNIVSEDFLELRGRESEYFLDSLLEFLSKNSLGYKDLQGVIVVNGPGSFTAMRIITLTINTLSFVHYIPLYSVDYFMLGELSGWTYPLLLRANRGEYLLKKAGNTIPELIAISDIEPGTYFGIGDVNDFTNGTISIQSTLRYPVFCKNFPIENPTERIEPIYIKKPNIT